MAGVQLRSWFVWSIACVGVLLSACGDDGPPGHPPTEAGLRSAALQQVSTMIASPGDTYRFLSSECKDRVSRSEWAGQMLLATGMLESFYDLKLSDLEAGDVEVRNVTETTGEAWVTVLTPDGSPLDDSEDFAEFVYEDGDWRSTDCETFGSSDSDEDSDSDEASVITGDLRPADEITEERRREESVDAAIGETVAVEGLSVTVSAIRAEEESAGSDAEDYRIAIEVRVENRTASDASNPEIQVTCADSDETGTWYGDSTFDMYGELPSGSFDEGTLILGVPADCREPVVRVGSPFADGDIVDWAVPAEVQPAP